VASSIAEYFGIICERKQYCWKTLSHSQRIAQSAAWIILLEAAFRGKLASPDQFQNLYSTPTYVLLKSGFCIVWYDNIIAGFNSDCRDIFKKKLLEVCDEQQCFNITISSWKHGI
jgi:hypothetical protein